MKTSPPEQHPIAQVTPDCVAGDRVLAWGVSDDDQSTIARAVTACGATLVRADATGVMTRVPESTRCRTAVVALDPSSAGGEPIDGPRLEFIKGLTDRGYAVVAYMRSAAVLPLAARCRVYLAGCSALLDRADDTFAVELERTLGRTVKSIPEARAEQARIRSVMAEVGAVGDSPELLAVFERLVRISALSDLSTLITGETGTGKELLARGLHALDAKRRRGPFVALNCSAISPMLAESELFGHRRGAFTGADRERAGLIRAADGGVLFLDEIGELSGPLQAKLLRVLQEGRVLAVGDERETAVSIRVIAATNADLRTMVEQGTFRADLFHRLNTLSLHLPPLRERRGDIVPLIGHFVARHRALNPAAGGPGAITWEASFASALSELELPGNARQLENLVRAALVHNVTGRLALSDLPREVWRQLAGAGAVEPANGAADLQEPRDWNLSRSLDFCERSLIAGALRATAGNQARAARLLGITPRSVYNKVRRHKLA